MAAMASCGEVQKALQAVAQGLQWTYALLWQLCPERGYKTNSSMAIELISHALVWVEGHYNGAIKTRKTVQSAAAPPAPDEPTAAEAVDQAARDRSRQLQELFESLAREAAAASGICRAHGGVHESAAVRRPSAALAPEDLTETEWFYLMSASYSFPPGVGLPGKAFARRGHLWLSKANGVDSKTFSRAILAKSAGIQTVVCIPIVEGVLEIGTIEKVEEDIGLVQHAVRLFIDLQDIHMMPSISEHSTSNQIPHIDQQSLQTQRKIHTSGQAKVESNKFSPEYGNNEMEHGDDEIDAECASGSETNNGRNYWQHAPLNFVSPDQATHNAGSSALMQLEVSERVRDGCSSNLDDEIQMLMVCQNSNDMSSLHGQDEPCHSWHFLYEDLCSGHHQSGEDQAINLPENAHYSKTVMSILHQNARQQADTNIKSYLSVSHQSSFCRWDPTMQKCMIAQGTPNRMLKSVLFFSDAGGHCRQLPDPRNGGEGASGVRRGDLGANHVLKERRRREKLSERFIILRSLVPFVTKVDKASILGDTIEYVKQLRKRIQDLESAASRQVHGNLQVIRQHPAVSVEKKSSCSQRCGATASAERRRKLRAVEGSSTGSSAPVAVAVQQSTDVQVSIIESDALVEVRCPYRSGLLVLIMQAIQRELELEITSVEASSDGGVLVAELRAKVKEVHGRRSTSNISEAKRAINMIISSGSM